MFRPNSFRCYLHFLWDIPLPPFARGKGYSQQKYKKYLILKKNLCKTFVFIRKVLHLQRV